MKPREIVNKNYKELTTDSAYVLGTLVGDGAKIYCRGLN